MIIKVLYTFIMFLEIMLIMYMVGSWLLRINVLTKKLYDVLAPILEPLEKLSKKSILYMPIVDLSPILLLVVLIYIEQILYNLL